MTTDRERIDRTRAAARQGAARRAENALVAMLEGGGFIAIVKERNRPICRTTVQPPRYAWVTTLHALERDGLVQRVNNSVIGRGFTFTILGRALAECGSSKAT